MLVGMTAGVCERRLRADERGELALGVERCDGSKRVGRLVPALSLFQPEKTAHFVLWATELLHWLYMCGEPAASGPSKPHNRAWELGQA